MVNHCPFSKLLTVRLNNIDGKGGVLNNINSDFKYLINHNHPASESE